MVVWPLPIGQLMLVDGVGVGVGGVGVGGVGVGGVGVGGVGVGGVGGAGDGGVVHRSAFALLAPISTEYRSSLPHVEYE